MIRQPVEPFEEEEDAGSWAMWWALLAGLAALGTGYLSKEVLRSGEGASIAGVLFVASVLFVAGWFVWFLLTIRTHIRRGVSWALWLATPERTGYIPSPAQTGTLVVGLFATVIGGLVVLLVGVAIAQNLEGCTSQYLCADPGSAVAVAGAFLLVFGFFVPAVVTRWWAHAAAGAPPLLAGPRYPLPAPIEAGRTQRACLSCLRVIPVSASTCPFCGAAQI